VSEQHFVNKRRIKEYIRLKETTNLSNTEIAQHLKTAHCSTRATGVELRRTTELSRRGVWDPFKPLGLGYFAYFRTMRNLAIMMWVFALPTLFIFFTYL
jgi:hypothetical protein